MPYMDVKDFMEEAMHGSPIWRLIVTFLLIGVLAALYVAFGLPGTSGFAWAKDVDGKIETKIQQTIAPLIAEQQDQKGILEDIQRRLLRQQIFDLQKTILAAKKEQCTAWREGRNASYWTDQLTRMKQDYIELTGRGPDIPTSCTEI